MKIMKYRFLLAILLVLFTLLSIIGIQLRCESKDPVYFMINLLHGILSIKHFLMFDPDRSTISAKYRAFETLLRLKPVRIPDPMTDPSQVLKQLRSSFFLNSIIPQPTGCQLRKQLYTYEEHSVETYWINYHQQEKVDTDHILVYFHGGAYLVGNVQSKRFDQPQ